MIVSAQPGVNLAAYVPVEYRERLVELARLGDRSLSAEVRRAIAAYLDNNHRASVMLRKREPRDPWPDD